MKKRQYNFSLPEPLIAEFEKMAKPYGVKRKWMVASVAIVRLMELGPSGLREYLETVGSAEIRGDYQWLIQQAEKRVVDVDDNVPDYNKIVADTKKSKVSRSAHAKPATPDAQPVSEGGRRGRKDQAK